MWADNLNSQVSTQQGDTGRTEQVASVRCGKSSGVAILVDVRRAWSLTVAREVVLLPEEAAQDKVDHVDGLVGALAQRPRQLLQVPLDVLLQKLPRVPHRRLDDVDQSLGQGDSVSNEG